MYSTDLTDAWRNIYLIFKEALNNVIKYANGSNVWICISKEKQHLLLSLKDDGVGFDASRLNGDGLQNIKNRAFAMQESVAIRSKINSGFEVEIKIPV